MAGLAVQRGEDDFSVAAVGDGFDSLTDDLRARVKVELEPGERLLWAARSEPPFVRFGMGFYVWIAIAAFLLVLGVYCIGRSLDRGRFSDGSEMGLGTFLMVLTSLIGIGVIGHVFSRLKQHVQDASVCYAITERRAIIWTPDRRSNAVRIRTFPRGEIRNLVRVQTPDGSGSLLFAPRASVSAEDFNVNWIEDGFRYIRAVRRVEQVLRSNLVAGERSV